MTAKEAIAALDALKGDDPEGDHCEADEILLAVVPPTVKQAYERAEFRAGGWWYA